MASEQANRQPSPTGHIPWWVAAAGGGGSIMAAVLQDHALGWAIAVAFIAWLLHNIAIAWIGRTPTTKAIADRATHGNCEQSDRANAAETRPRRQPLQPERLDAAKSPVLADMARKS
jgi:hypothetical protein